MNHKHKSKLSMKNFFYNNILKNVLSLSKLGRTTVKGLADSGLNIDHMYRDRAKGITFAGRLIDSILLNLPSVKATRKKKDIIIKILQNEISNNIILKRKTRILDLASGPARYLVELIDGSNQNFVEILCIDADKRSVNFGKTLSGKRPIRFARANVFKAEHLIEFSKKINWLPNIIMTTGFFEMQTDQVVKNLLKEIYQALDSDSLILFTAQASNPSEKLMKNVGKTQSGKPWEMYFRAPEQLREWIINCGFRNVIISLDTWGVYEYCTGRKV